MWFQKSIFVGMAVAVLSGTLFVAGTVATATVTANHQQEPEANQAKPAEQPDLPNDPKDFTSKKGGVPPSTDDGDVAKIQALRDQITDLEAELQKALFEEELQKALRKSMAKPKAPGSMSDAEKQQALTDAKAIRWANLPAIDDELVIEQRSNDKKHAFYGRHGSLVCVFFPQKRNRVTTHELADDTTTVIDFEEGSKPVLSFARGPSKDDEDFTKRAMTGVRFEPAAETLDVPPKVTRLAVYLHRDPRRPERPFGWRIKTLETPYLGTVWPHSLKQRAMFYQVGRVYHAYSAVTDKWSEITLGDQDGDALWRDGDRLIVGSGDSVHIFDSIEGKWLNFGPDPIPKASNPPAS